MIWRRGGDQSPNCLDAGNTRADRDRGNDRQPGPPLRHLRLQRKGDRERHRRQRVTEVVDEIGKQRDAAACHEHQDLNRGRRAQHCERLGNSTDALARPRDGVFDESVGVPIVRTMSMTNRTRRTAGGLGDGR